MRLDQYLAEKHPNKSRAFFAKLIKSGAVQVNSEIIRKSSYKVLEDDNVVYDIPVNEVDISIKPIKIDFEIIADMKDYLVINKPKNIAVHPSSTSNEPSIVNGLIYHYKNQLSNVGGSTRPGIVHRLDKDTTGILVIAKNDDFHRHFASQLENRTTEKEYLALVFGRVVDGEIDSPISRSAKDPKKMAVNKTGKSARTIIKCLEYFPESNISYLSVVIKSGRTHQIRVHLSAIGHPVLGDMTYGDKKLNEEFEKYYSKKLDLENFSQYLHSHCYSFYDLNQQKQTFKSDPNFPLEILRG